MQGRDFEMEPQFLPWFHRVFSLNMHHFLNFVQAGRLPNIVKISPFLFSHLMLHIILGWTLTREGDNQLRECTCLNKIVQFILINEILHITQKCSLYIPFTRQNIYIFHMYIYTQKKGSDLVTIFRFLHPKKRIAWPSSAPECFSANRS